MNDDDAGQAPPPSDQSNHAPSDLTREYDGRGIRVQWFASRCIHVGVCLRAMPRVFDSRRRPWIDLSVDEANADAVAETVMRCPTGALQFERLDGGPQEQPAPATTARTIPRGPLFLRGDIEVLDDAGQLIRRDTRVAICRCTKSRHMPFCDNSHREKVHVKLGDATPPAADEKGDGP